MQDWRESYITLGAEAKSESEVFNVLTNIASELGFEHSSYGLRAPLPIADPKFVLYSDYPCHWEERYVSKNYFNVDPTVRHALSSGAPLIWSSAQPAENLEFWDEAKDHGLNYGWSLPAHGPYGTIGLLSLVRSNEVISSKELDAKELKMTWLTIFVHAAMAQFLAPKMLPECRQALTPREREILQWTATGKTYYEIGIILSIDDRTVKFHLVNAMRKLNASNKTEAAIKASTLGMLF